MAKNTNRVASLIAYVAALGLATSASAYHWEMYVNNDVTYAKEIFGGDDPASIGLTLSADDPATTDDTTTTDVIENDEQTSVDLRLYLPPDTTVAADSEVEVVLKLEGAVLGQAIDWTDIRTDDNVDEATPSAALRKVGGSQVNGRRDDASITFKLDTAAAIPAPAGGGYTGNFVRIDLGSLKGYAGTGSVDVKAEMRVTDGNGGTSGGDRNFPTTFDTRDDAEAMDPDGTPASGDEVAAVIGTSEIIARSAQAVTLMVTGGDTGRINVGDRAKLVGGTQVKVATVDHEIASATAKVATGDKNFADENGTEGDMTVTVTGMIRDSDTVFFDADGDGMMGTKEGFSINDGVAKGVFRFGDGDVYFKPDGETPMTQGDLKASFDFAYDVSSVIDPPSGTGNGKLAYNGVETEARAYAIPPATHADDGNVRIRCGASGDSMCTVFLDCSEQDGTGHFGELSGTIAAGATEHLTGSDIADVLGIDDWTGRLSCNVLSAEDVSVQVLVRSGEVLVNNTYISGPADD